MGLETATYIHELDSSNPVGASDPKGQGDDHLKLIKSTLQNTFPNIEGEVTGTHTELNDLTDAAESIAALLAMFAGVKIAFFTSGGSASPSGGNFIDGTKANKNCTGTHTNGSGLYTVDFTAAGFTRAPAVFVMANNPNLQAGVVFRQFSAMPTTTGVTYQFANLSHVLSDSPHYFFAVGD